MEPLLTAIQDGDLDRVKLTIIPYLKDIKQSSLILKWAIQSDQFHICRYLLERGVQPGISDEQDQTCFSSIFQNTNYREYLDLLLQYGRPSTTEVVELFQCEFLPEFILEKILTVYPINRLLPSGRTLLHEMCLGRHRSRVALLLRFGADPTIPDSKNIFPINDILKDVNSLFLQEDIVSIIRLLLFYGAILPEEYAPNYRFQVVINKTVHDLIQIWHRINVQNHPDDDPWLEEVDNFLYEIEQTHRGNLLPPITQKKIRDLYVIGYKRLLYQRRDGEK